MLGRCSRSPRTDGSRLRGSLGVYSSPASPIGRTVDLALNSRGDWALSTVAEGADLDIADQRLPSGARARPVSLAQPKPWRLPAAKPEMNRQERVISTAYLVMIAPIVAFLAVTGLVAWLGARRGRWTRAPPAAERRAPRRLLSGFAAGASRRELTRWQRWRRGRVRGVRGGRLRPEPAPVRAAGRGHRRSAD